MRIKPSPPVGHAVVRSVSEGASIPATAASDRTGDRILQSLVQLPLQDLETATR